MKSWMKILLGIFIFNAVMNHLRNEEIITGQININYSKLVSSVTSNNVIRFVDTDINQYPDRNTIQYLPPDNYRPERQQYQERNMRYHQRDEERIEDLFNEDEMIESGYAPEPISDTSVHVVRNGETLITLGTTYGISWRRIKDINGIYDVNDIRPGQKIWIPNS
ncbi:LysM peptidoglycan-binding domain-containing protein [candidate division KSB1 bacterium]|nr:LysM peptidoglycan-binding domain-containing protein [candidate division KSB1 bacterium]